MFINRSKWCHIFVILISKSYLFLFVLGCRNMRNNTVATMLLSRFVTRKYNSEMRCSCRTNFLRSINIHAWAVFLAIFLERDRFFILTKTSSFEAIWIISSEYDLMHFVIVVRSNMNNIHRIWAHAFCHCRLHELISQFIEYLRKSITWEAWLRTSRRPLNPMVQPFRCIAYFDHATMIICLFWPLFLFMNMAI